MTRKRILPVLLAGALLALAPTGKANAEEGVATVQLGGTGPLLTVLEPRIFEELAVFPLKAEAVTDGSKYKHLDTAVSDRSVSITEWGSGTVPNLKVANKGKGKVFIMTGEIMTGAKQDRMSAHDVLLGPGSGPVKLPVYCVEQGRWVKRSDRFAAGHTAGTRKLRKSAVAKSSQGKIWSDVAEKSAESGVHSSTGTMQAVYNDAQLAKKIKTYEKAFADLPSKTPDMVGFVVAIRGRIGSADLFANPPLLDGLWKKLIKAAATDAVTADRSGKSPPTVEQVAQFLGAGIEGDYKSIDNPGLGKEFLIEGQGGVTGSTLIHGTNVVHMALFAPDKSDGPRELRNGIRYDTPQSSYGGNSGGKGSIGNGGPPPWFYEKKRKKKSGKGQTGKPKSRPKQQKKKKSKKKSQGKQSSWNDDLEK